MESLGDIHGEVRRCQCRGSSVMERVSGDLVEGEPTKLEDTPHELGDNIRGQGARVLGRR